MLKSYQNKNNKLIKKFLEKNIISKKQAKYLDIHNAVPPQIYGLPKLHKPGMTNNIICTITLL